MTGLISDKGGVCGELVLFAVPLTVLAMLLHPREVWRDLTGR